MAESARIIAHRCTHCGASIGFEAGAGRTTCVYCGSQLEIGRGDRHGDQAGSGAVQGQAENVAASVQVLRLQQELAELDRGWTLKQQEFMTKDAEGKDLPPSEEGAYVNGILAGGFGIVVGAGMTCSGMWIVGPLAGVFFVGLGIYSGILEKRRADRFGRARRRYEGKRQQLLGAIRGDQG